MTDAERITLPALDDALQEVAAWVAPVTTGENDCATGFADFTVHSGAQLYEALREQTVNNPDNNWMSDLWKRRFLTSREVLPFSSMMATKIDWRASQNGLKRVAHFAAALVRAYVVSLKAEADAAPKSWQRLFCACRIPASPKDKFKSVETRDANELKLIVLFHGYAWEIQVTDSKGAIVNPAQLESVLYRITQEAEEDADIPFTSISLLDNQTEMEIKKQLLSRDENHRLLRKVETSLFVLSLDDTHFSDEDEALADAMFGEGFWAYKPLNFICHYADDRIFLTFERSYADPTTIMNLLSAAEPYFYDVKLPRKNALATDLSRQRLTWTIDGRKTGISENLPGNQGLEGTLKTLNEGLADYRRQSEYWTITTHDVFVTAEDFHLLDQKYYDAISQLLLLYGEFVAFHKIASICDFIDLHHFSNGRCDLLETTTAEAVTLVKRLHARTATPAMLDAALTAHQARWQAVKDGQGVISFMLVLKYLAKIQGLRCDIFADDCLAPLFAPDVNTLTVKNGALISSMVMLPINASGIGVNYQITRSHIKFVFCYKRQLTAQMDSMRKAISSGLKQLFQLLRET